MAADDQQPGTNLPGTFQDLLGSIAIENARRGGDAGLLQAVGLRLQIAFGFGTAQLPLEGVDRALPIQLACL